MSDEIMEEAVTETAAETPQVQEAKTFTQEELDRIVADRIARTKRQYEKRLEGIDLDEARSLLQRQQEAEIEEQKKRGEYEKLLKEQADSFKVREAQKDARLEKLLVDGALLEAASSLGAVEPVQVSRLLRDQVKLSQDGDTAEVYDANGLPRYDESGELLSVQQLVGDFLSSNPHFVKATSGGVGSQGAVGGSTPKPMSAVDMVNNYSEGGREAYRAMMLKNKNR